MHKRDSTARQNEKEMEYEMQQPVSRDHTMQRHFDEIRDGCLQWTMRVGEMSMKAKRIEETEQMLLSFQHVQNALMMATSHLENRSNFQHTFSGGSSRLEAFITQLGLILLTIGWKCSTACWSCLSSLSKETYRMGSWFGFTQELPQSLQWYRDGFDLAMTIFEQMLSRVASLRKQFPAIEETGGFVEVESQVIRLREIMQTLKAEVAAEQEYR